MSSLKPEGFPGYFDDDTTRQLLAPINPRRIKNANGHDHVPGHEVIAHLIRIFGFGNFTYEMVEPPECIFEVPRTYTQQGTVEVGSGNRKQTVQAMDAPHTWRWDVAYRATVRLTIYDKAHNLVCWYEDSSTGDASNSTRADAHDLALKSAITLAKKRCAVHLGDQFGLSLYNKGQRTAMVQRVMVAAKTLLAEWRAGTPAGAIGERAHEPDVSAGVEEQRSMGIDERRGNDDAEETPEQTEQLAHSVGARPKSGPEFQRGHQQDEPHSPEDAS